MAQNDQELLTRLKANDLDFVVIGDVCCVYYGVLIATFGLHICCRFDEPSLRKIQQALVDLHPFHRLTANKLPLELSSELCLSLKAAYLRTDLGSLDCLSEVAGIGGYEEVRGRSVVAKFSFGEFRFLTLDGLIQTKETAVRDRDFEALTHLRVIKERMGRQ